MKHRCLDIAEGIWGYNEGGVLRLLERKRGPAGGVTTS